MYFRRSDNDQWGKCQQGKLTIHSNSKRFVVQYIAIATTMSSCVIGKFPNVSSRYSCG